MDIKKSIEYLNDALETIGNISQTEAAKTLGIAQNTLSQYKQGERIMDDYACIVVAETLKIDPLIVITAANIDREQGKKTPNESRLEAWEKFRQKLGIEE